MNTVSPVPVAEDAARRVLLVQAFDTGPADNPLWTADDARWATRLARQTTPQGAAPQDFLDERARHALQRLVPRDKSLPRLLARRLWRWWWLLLALLTGLLAGLLVDVLGGGQRINLLAPPVWGVLAWNGAVYLSLLLPVPKRLRARLGQALTGRLSGKATQARFQAAWARLVAPLTLQRAALLLHAAAAALAAGLIAGLYLRGLVLDYRAGWQSTFLDAGQVQALLSTLLAPAAALTGLAVPDVSAARVGPEVVATAPAATWIHLYAAMLLAFVVLPRGGLVLLAALRARYLAGHLRLPLAEPYFQRLLRDQQGRAALVQVLAHGVAPTPHSLTCLQAVLAAPLGDGVQLRAAPATGYGHEEQAAAIAPEPGAGLRLALVDLVATPEDDSHGAFVQALRRGAPAVPLLVLADEAAFKRRFASMPARVQERRKAWQAWARQQGVPLVCADLAQPDLAAVERDIEAALREA